MFKYSNEKLNDIRIMLLKCVSLERCIGKPSRRVTHVLGEGMKLGSRSSLFPWSRYTSPVIHELCFVSTAFPEKLVSHFPNS